MSGHLVSVVEHGREACCIVVDPKVRVTPIRRSKVGAVVESGTKLETKT